MVQAAPPISIGRYITNWGGCSDYTPYPDPNCGDYYDLMVTIGTQIGFSRPLGSPPGEQ